jgi:photosystem II stability/assembly factor-like uncharacterized protein
MSEQPYAGLLERLAKFHNPNGGQKETRVLMDEAAEAISSLLNALGTARAALADDRIGTIYQDDPDWYRMVDDAVAAIDAALNSDASTQTVGGE